MRSRGIQVEQQCHGYKGGHQLLASSVKLPREDQDTIDRLSDISGPLRPNEKFLPYITTYPLPGGEFYVVARTWQDLEARRAGCVLTRSLLIRTDQWAATEDIESLVHLLKVVDRNEPDATSIYLEAKSTNRLPQVDVSQTTELVEALFLEERQPIVVFGASQSELIIIRLLTALWPGLKRSFSTCSHALGPRMASGRAFDLIFTPKDLRSRFAKWDGRRIDGSGERDKTVRHRWSIATARRIFEDPIPALSKIDALGILARDTSGDESKLRLSLLWNDLIDQSHESPTAVLGMLDILQTQIGDLSARDIDIDGAVATAVLRSKGMEPSKRLGFLIPLAIKLENQTISLSLSVNLYRGLSEAATQSLPESVHLLSQATPGPRFASKLLFAGVGRGISLQAGNFVSGRLFSGLSDEHLQCLLAVSSSFAHELVGTFPSNTDEAWIARLTAALGFPASGFAATAKKRVVMNLTSERQAGLLGMCLRGSPDITPVEALRRIWKKTKLAVASFDSVLLEALPDRQELLHFRGVLLQLPETEETTRLLRTSLNTSVEDMDWILRAPNLRSARRRDSAVMLLRKADDNLLGRISQIRDLVELLMTALASRPLTASERAPFLKVLAWSTIPIDDVLVVALPILRGVNDGVRQELSNQLLFKGLRLANASSNEQLNALIHELGAGANPDHLVASAASPESSPRRISDNLKILNGAPPLVRGEVLRYIDNLSLRLVQNHPERLSEEGCVAWAELIEDAGTINPLGQLRAAGAALSFAFSQADARVLPLVLVAFPLIYRELKEGKEESSLWTFFFPDWDRCKTIRKELIRNFLHSDWSPSFFFRATLPTDDIDRILHTVSKEEGGTKYLKLLEGEASSLDPEVRKRVLGMIRGLIHSESQELPSESHKRKHRT